MKTKTEQQPEYTLTFEDDLDCKPMGDAAMAARFTHNLDADGGPKGELLVLGCYVLNAVHHGYFERVGPGQYRRTEKPALVMTPDEVDQ